MSKGKLAKFADMERFENVFQYPYSVVDDVPFDMKGKWREMYFHNDNPIVHVSLHSDGKKVDKGKCIGRKQKVFF